LVDRSLARLKEGTQHHCYAIHTITAAALGLARSQDWATALGPFRSLVVKGEVIGALKYRSGNAAKLEWERVNEVTWNSPMVR
jgi:hypothetical protein